MKTTIELPALIEVNTHDEFISVQEYYKILNPKIKVKEVAFADHYMGIAYIGKLSDKENAELIKYIYQIEKEYEKA